MWVLCCVNRIEHDGKIIAIKRASYRNDVARSVPRTITLTILLHGVVDASGWEVTGLDWKSGATRHRSILGKSNRANGAYAIIQYLANGDLLFNSVAGPIRVKY